MMDMIARWTSLPNIHPLLVHFPIALLPTALALELVGLLRARPWWASRAAVVLLILGAVLTFAAYEAGEEAAEGLTRVPPAAQPVLAEHDKAASWALRLTILALLLRIAVAFHGRSRTAWYRAERGLSALVTALAVVAVAWTADLGGRLVYDHGLAVRAMPAVADPDPEDSLPPVNEAEAGPTTPAPANSPAPSPDHGVEDGPETAEEPATEDVGTGQDDTGAHTGSSPEAPASGNPAPGDEEAEQTGVIPSPPVSAPDATSTGS